MSQGAGVQWRNWCGLERACPGAVLSPSTEDEVVAAVRAAREAGGTVKMTGTGHSFTPIARPEGTWLRPERLSGVLAVDRERYEVTAQAGTPLKDLNAACERLGLSLHNMGDIAEQTLAGATATGTHGTGGVAAGLAAQLSALTLVTGTGELLRASADENPDVFAVARVGLGALGVLTELTFRVEPLFSLEAHERSMSWAEAMATYDAMVDDAHHVDAYWFPHTDRVMVKSNTRLAEEGARPPHRLSAWLSDELLPNHLFGLLASLGSRRPGLVPLINRASAAAWSDRRYTDRAHRVFTSPRRVVFREMEYAVPRADGLEVLRECRRVIERNDWRIGFPVEVRSAPADDVALSTASGRDTMYLAFHTHHAADHRPVFAGLEPVLRAAAGRPHWGKLHTMTAPDLAAVYPRFPEFLAMRDRLDPDRVFANAHLRRVLGP